MSTSNGQVALRGVREPMSPRRLRLYAGLPNSFVAFANERELRQLAKSLRRVRGYCCKRDLLKLPKSQISLGCWELPR